MKKLALLAGLSGLLITGAMAQNSPINLSVGTFRAFTFDNVSSIGFTINDGGFNGPYVSSGRGYSVQANVTWSLLVQVDAGNGGGPLANADVTPNMPVGSMGTWNLAASASSAGNNAGAYTIPGGATGVKATLTGTGVGHFIAPGGFAPTPVVVVTIS